MPRLARVDSRLASLVILWGLMALAGVAALAPRFAPDSDEVVRRAATGAIFIASYAALAIGKIPGLAIDRAGIALVGACLMVVAGAIPLEDAYRAIDLDTITLLLGMMIVVANLRLSGFFRLVSAWAVTRARHPALLLSAIVLVTGVLSAFLVNDAICLVMTPLVIELTRALDRNPAPYRVAMASNVGSTATITGNPQNMIIGSLSQIPYTRFAAALAPVALVGLALTAVLLALLYRAELRGEGVRPRLPRMRVN